MTIILSIVGCLVGSGTVLYGPRLFPKYKPGTKVLVSMDSPPILCRYLRRSSFAGYHKAEILPGDDLGWDGKVITCKTSELQEITP